MLLFSQNQIILNIIWFCKTSELLFKVKLCCIFKLSNLPSEVLVVLHSLIDKSVSKYFILYPCSFMTVANVRRGNPSLSFSPGLWPPHQRKSWCSSSSSWGSFICGPGHKCIRGLLYIVIVGHKCPRSLCDAPVSPHIATNYVICQQWTQNPNSACRDQNT